MCDRQALAIAKTRRKPLLSSFFKNIAIYDLKIEFLKGFREEYTSGYKS